MSQRTAILFCLTFPFGACESNRNIDAPYTVRDSAGVTIVESFVPLWSPSERWAVNPEPILDLATSGTGPPHEFFRVWDATVLRDGVIAVANVGSGEIRLFSDDGTFRHGLGRTGEGPGEFRWIGNLERYLGDSVVVVDNRLRRATVVNPEGGQLRTVSFHDHLVWKLKPLDDGSFIGKTLYPTNILYEGRLGLLREPVPLVHFSPKGLVIDSLAMAAGSETLVIENGSMLPLFGKDSHFDIHANLIYLGDAEVMEVKVLSASGQLDRVIRVPDFDLRISIEDIEREREARLPPDPSPRALEGFSDLPIPDLKPAYSNLIVDEEGFLWLEEYLHVWATQTTAQPSKWNIFNPEGGWLGSVDLPPRFRVFEIGPDYLLGVFWDDMDVEHVQMLRLVRQ